LKVYERAPRGWLSQPVFNYAGYLFTPAVDIEMALKTLITLVEHIEPVLAQLWNLHLRGGARP